MTYSRDSFYAEEDEFLVTPQRRSRNIWMTLFLGFLIAGYCFSIIVNVAALANRESEALMAELYRFPVWVVPAITVCALLNIVCVFALLQWKKWGFYGFFAATLVMGLIPLVGSGLGSLVARWQAGTFLSSVETWEQLANLMISLAAITALFIFLRIGGQRSLWKHLD